MNFSCELLPDGKKYMIGVRSIGKEQEFKISALKLHIQHDYDDASTMPYHIWVNTIDVKKVHIQYPSEQSYDKVSFVISNLTEGKNYSVAIPIDTKEPIYKEID